MPRAPASRPLLVIITVTILLSASATLSIACPSDLDAYAEQKGCGDACMSATTNLFRQLECVNTCNAALSKTLDANAACRKLEQQQKDQQKIDEQSAAEQKRIEEQRAEMNRIAEEERARDAGAEWASNGRSGQVWMGDDIIRAGSDVTLFRDGKVVDVMNYRDEIFRFGPGDVFKTALGPVEVSSQVENIVYGKDTVVQYIGMQFNPPRIDAQQGDWDYARNFQVSPNREWAFLGGLVKDMAEFNLASASFLGGAATCVAAPAMPFAAPVCGGLIIAYMGLGTVYFDSKIKHDRGVNVILTPSVAIAHEGTQFTVAVADNGTTTVTTLNGSVIIMDIMSRKGTYILKGQTITVPKTTTGLTQEELLQRVTYVNPDTLEQWWVEKPTSPLDTPWLIPSVLAAAIIICGLVILKKTRKKDKRKQ